MPIANSRLLALGLGLAIVAGLTASCANPESVSDSEDVQSESTSLTANQRLAACDQDPRVTAGLVTRDICAGADIFFRETFNGNGRTCGSCHPVAHNFTVDGPFITALFNSKPQDPLFVSKNNPDLAQLETNQLFNGGILENVDGFEDPTHKFITRSVPHMLSLATSITPDTADLTTNPPKERTGWSGDGAPGTGTLREFLSGAITQHYPKTLARQAGVDFRAATSQELDLTLAFQKSLGRLNELNLTQVHLNDADAESGRLAYLDPQRGRCNFCHANGGANSQQTGLNKNFDTGTRFRPVFGADGTTPNGGPLFDGGFGGQGLAQPNVVAFPLFAGDTTPNGFGNNTFNTPPVIEASDTLPGFHNNSATTPEAIVGFYVSPDFRNSKASQDLVAIFGTEINFDGDETGRIARFIRILNLALNLDMAKQRLSAAQTLVTLYHDTKPQIQTTLMQLAENELNDGQLDLNDGLNPIQPCYPTSQSAIAQAKTEIDLGVTAPSWQERFNRIVNALARVKTARDQIGTNLNFTLGKGNLMF